MEKTSSSVQSWVEEHKLATIGAVWAAAVAGASVAYSRRRGAAPAARLRLIHAPALTVAVLGGAALTHYYFGGGGKKKAAAEGSSLDYDFYSQLPPATSPDGQENERWSY